LKIRNIIIYRNVKKNSEKPLSNLYLYGTSVVQLYVLIFIYSLDSNVNIDKFNYKFIYFIIGYTLLQVLILSLQNIFGPLFLIPSKVYNLKIIRRIRIKDMLLLINYYKYLWYILNLYYAI